MTALFIIDLFRNVLMQPTCRYYGKARRLRDLRASETLSDDGGDQKAVLTGVKHSHSGLSWWWRVLWSRSWWLEGWNTLQISGWRRDIDDDCCLSINAVMSSEMTDRVSLYHYSILQICMWNYSVHYQYWYDSSLFQMLEYVQWRPVALSIGNDISYTIESCQRGKHHQAQSSSMRL
jgi:hypothetical protein